MSQMPASEATSRPLDPTGALLLRELEQVPQVPLGLPMFLLKLNHLSTESS
ncbi:MAG TPA: hypothetical protein VF179_22475 [Thermoanaerobaculia bacterium]|nr:hypothetical protein [Thermoanaerobaculia bacterium]